MTTSAKAVVLISETFTTLASGANLNGRTPDGASVVGGNWIAPTGSFVGNGAGGLTTTYSAGRTMGFDLGAGYLSNNPGIYELSVTITNPSTANTNTSWMGVGFAAGTNDSLLVSDNLVANNGTGWLLYRLSGATSVYGGAGTGNTLINNAAVGTTGTTLGSAQTFTLRLDTSLPKWTLDAFVVTPTGTYVYDLDATGSGTTYTYGTSPTNIRYVTIAAGANGTPTVNGTVDNFTLTGPAPIPEPSTLLLSGLAMGGLFLRRRRN